MNKVIEIIDSDDDSHTPTSTTNTLQINNMEPDDNQQSQSRRRRRKSVLHVMTDPDMQFQTISLEDDDDDADINVSNQQNFTQKNQVKSLPGTAPASRTLLKTVKIAPKIIPSKATANDEIVNASFEKFINDPETINDIYAIAEERARINYLLTLNGLPDINFTLYTRPERLQFEFEERLKQRKVVSKWDNKRLLDNRRSLLQNNEQNTL